VTCGRQSLGFGKEDWQKGGRGGEGEGDGEVCTLFRQLSEPPKRSSECEVRAGEMPPQAAILGPPPTVLVPPVPLSYVSALSHLFISV
jgi:hypothetical protein